MGFMKLFSSSKKDKDAIPTSVAFKSAEESNTETETIVSGGSLRSKSSKSSKSSHKKKSKKSKSKATKTETDVKPSRSINELTVEGYFDTCQKHGSVEEMCSFFSSPDVVVALEDGPPVTAHLMVSEIQKVNLSFPNVQYTYNYIKEVRPNEVLVEEIQVKGTHTGAPYAFATFPPVPASNIHVDLDPERLWITMNPETGKIDKMSVVALGNLTGPPGMYMAVGGSLAPPPENDAAAAAAAPADSTEEQAASS